MTHTGEKGKRKESENRATHVTFNLSSASVMPTVLIEFHQEKTIKMEERTIKSRQLERTIEMTNGAHGQNATKGRR